MYKLTVGVDQITRNTFQLNSNRLLSSNGCAVGDSTRQRGMLPEKTRGDGQFADQSVTFSPGRTLTHTGGTVLDEAVKQKKKEKKKKYRVRTSNRSLPSLRTKLDIRITRVPQHKPRARGLVSGNTPYADTLPCLRLDASRPTSVDHRLPRHKKLGPASSPSVWIRTHNARSAAEPASMFAASVS